ncbi:uncharacterized protein LDX57_007721 [Aspergillus melleus]|uniref:uncharacterized protein n=1 Tax=Aspergillus melleus TaxID=138277 RepID=UPI001E8EB5AD|nr:uncharacterized protein LDX57_007721 [Aspergillus melleus]KAH8430050.1 hypothetical protein LDX57_007721 [Aspergillus melleus]
MKSSSEPNEDSSDEELLVAPPFTTIGLSIPPISWLNRQLEKDGDRPSTGGKEHNSKGEQPHETREALGLDSPCSADTFRQTPSGNKQTAR